MVWVTKTAREGSGGLKAGFSAEQDEPGGRPSSKGGMPMGEFNRVIRRFGHPVLVLMGWIAFVLGQSFMDETASAKLVLLSAARVLP